MSPSTLLGRRPCATPLTGNRALRNEYAVGSDHAFRYAPHLCASPLREHVAGCSQELTVASNGNMIQAAGRA